jgi:uncharacterized protein involved in exopolysaccharide biosynthesis
LLPKKYESEAKLFVRLGRESVSLDPTATTGATNNVQESRENQINSTRDMLKSRVILEGVVEKMGTEMILNGPPSDEAPSNNALTAVKSAIKGVMGVITSPLKFSTPVSEEEQAIDSLSKAINVSLGRNSSVIDVQCFAKSPKLAQDMLEAYLESFREHHVAANRTEGSLEFFSAQAAQLKTQLDNAMCKVRDAKNESGLVTIATEQEAIQAQLSAIKTLSVEAEVSLAAAQAEIIDLRETVDSLPEQVTTAQTAGFPNAATDNMRQEFFRLLVQANELETKLGTDHPLVKVRQKQVEKLEEVVEAQERERVQTTMGINDTRRNLELELRRAEALAASLTARSQSLKTQYVTLLERLREVNGHEVKISELEREASIAEVNYRAYVDHLEEARIGDAIEASRICNVNVVQPPSFIEAPISPRPSFILGLGFLAVMAGVVAVPLAWEYYLYSFRHAGTLDATLMVPAVSANGHARNAQPPVNV